MSRLPLWGIFLGTCAGLFGPAIIHAEDLGRLFFNSQERQVLNQKRLAPPKPAEPIPGGKAKAEEQASESVQLTPTKITGRVIRSSGNNTIWVNHSPNYVRRQAPHRTGN